MLAVRVKMSLGGGGVEPTLHLPVPEIQLLGVTQEEEWNEDEEILPDEEEGEGRNKVRLVRSHAIRDSVSPPPPERREEVGGVNVNVDQRSVISSSDGGEVGALEGGVASGEIFEEKTEEEYLEENVLFRHRQWEGGYQHT